VDIDISGCFDSPAEMKLDPLWAVFAALQTLPGSLALCQELLVELPPDVLEKVHCQGGWTG